MNKKNYIQPSMDVTNIRFGSVICESDQTASVTFGGEGDGEVF